MHATNSRQVVVTGVGPITTLGTGSEQSWRNLLNAKPGQASDRVFEVNGVSRAFPIYGVDVPDLRKLGLHETSLDAIKSWKGEDLGQDADLILFLACVHLALEDATLSYDAIEEAGLFLAHENAGLELFFAKAISFGQEARTSASSITGIVKGAYDECISVGYDVQTFMYLHLVAKAFGIHGYSLYTNNACSSGLYALEAASREIILGNSNIAIVAAVDTARYPYKFLWFEDQGLNARNGMIKPFQEAANGFILGEGGASLILEERRHAERRNAVIYAEYKGGGFALEGWKVTVPSPDTKWYELVMQKSLQKAHLKPSDIDLLTPHGIGSSATDAYEIASIEKVFGNKENQPPVTVFKPLLGHTLGASGMIEIALLMLMLKYQFVPHMFDVIHDKISERLRLVTSPQKTKLRRIMKTSCGFAGFNGALIFER